MEHAQKNIVAHIADKRSDGREVDVSDFRRGRLGSISIPELV